VPGEAPGRALCFPGAGNNLLWLNADGAGTSAAGVRATQADADPWFPSGTLMGFGSEGCFTSPFTSNGEVGPKC